MSSKKENTQKSADTNSRPNWFMVPAPLVSAQYIADGDYRTRKRKGTGPMLGRKFRRMVKEADDAE